MRSAALAAALLLVACSSPVPNRSPVGEPFPAVEGEALDGTPMRLPDALSGEPAVLLIGYVQDAQFDIDRWLLGLLQAEVAVPIYEVPTIESLVATQLRGTIDDGMRSGIPEEDWSSVVTVYGDAGEIVALTGNEQPRNARVVVLDPAGRVAWFHDEGYSARLALEVRERTEDLARPGGPEAGENRAPGE